MKKRLFRFLATTLATIVTVTSVAPTSVYAAQTESQMTVEEVQEVLEETVSGNGTISDNSIETFGEEGKLNYLYLEKSYVETPSEQNIIVSFGDEQTVIAKATLIVEDYETRERMYYNSEDCMDNLVLFNMPMNTENAGIYEVVAVSVTTEEGKTKYVQLDKTGMDAVYYGVNEEVVLSEEEPVPEEEVAVVETQVVTFEEGEVADTKESEIVTAVEEALDEAETHVEDDTLDVEVPLSIIGANNMGTITASDVAANKASGNLVVVIDPGHDSTHAGARANGLKEEELTLKIAKYCKAELENYDGVTVYMTRTGSACPHPGTTSTGCNKNRVTYAQSVGADVYVSIHLNSADSASAKGAEVFYPNSSYNASIGQEGANLANKIVRQLAALGLSNRGIAIRNSEDNTRYPDGSLADYYGVIKNSKLAGFPAVIVEHAFLTNASDAAFLSKEENLKKLGIADATGIADYYKLSTVFDVSANKPIVQNLNNNAGTFTVSIDGVNPYNKVSQVKFAVWNTANGQDDLVWYVANAKGNGKYTATINISKHGYADGTYNIHAYAFSSSGKKKYLNNVTCNVQTPALSMDNVSCTLSADGKNQSVTVTGVAGASEIRLAVWSVNKGQDDLRWYTATSDNAGNWKVNVPISNHKGSTGTYNVHVYGKNTRNVQKYMGCTTFNVTGATGGNITFKNIDSGNGKFTAELSGVVAKAGISKVEVAVWSTGNQSNLKWYTATRQSDGSYKVDIDISQHDYQYGVYKVHAYVTDGNAIRGYTTSANLEIKQPQPVIMATGNAMQSQFNVRATNVGYAGGVKGVQFAVWSADKGQDDLKWYSGKNSNGTWNVNVAVSNHKTAGKYNVHMYIVDKKGVRHYAGNTSFVVTGPTPGEISFSEVNAGQGTFRINIGAATAKAGIKNVRVAVWSDKNQKNLRWYEPQRRADGTYSIFVDVANHAYGYGKYNIHVYTTDGNDIKVYKGSTLMLEAPQPVFTAIGNANQTQFSVKGSNVAFAGGVKGVQYAVWSVDKGQDDMKWYTATKAADGVWSTNIKIADHKTAGKYNVHMYIIDKNGGKHYVGNTTFNVTAPTATSVETVNVKESDGLFGVRVNGVSAPSGVSKVQVAVWSTSNQSDMVWYTATKSGNGIYQIGADVRNHKNNTGTYNAHVYVTDGNGIRKYVGQTSCKIINVSNILHPIMGSTSVTVDQLMAYYNSVTTYPDFYKNSDAKTLRQFCQMYIDECNAEGVKAEVAFVQAMKETNFLRYGGDVGIAQYNFAGLGATGNGAKGESYPSVRIGIRAQVQHLKAYASTEPLNQACVDTRFKYVKRNTAPYCEWLGIKENPYGTGWATAVRYGYNIVERMNNLKNF